MNKIKFSIIGLGNIGRRHFDVIFQEKNAEIISICDIKEEKGKEINELYNTKIPFYTDFRKLLEETSPDIVTIATPHGLHAIMSIESAKKGKHILVEKPMALSVKEADEMIQVAKENNVKLFVVKQNRYNIPIAITKKVIDEKALGDIYMTECNIFWNRNEEYYLHSDWRGKKELEGGALHTQGSHFIDLMIWWFGEVKSAKTFIKTQKHDIEIEDCGTSLVEFNNGAIGTINWTTNVYNSNYEGSITIIAEKGTIKIGGKYLNKIEYWDVKSYPLPENIDFSDKPNNYGKYQGTSSNHDKLIHELIEQLTYNRKGVVEGDEGIKTIKAIELIYNS